MARLALSSPQKAAMECTESRSEGLLNDVYEKWKEGTDVGLLNDRKMSNQSQPNQTKAPFSVVKYFMGSCLCKSSYLFMYFDPC